MYMYLKITLTPCNKGVIIYFLRIIHLASNLISRFEAAVAEFKLLACRARGLVSIPRLATWISEIGYLPLQSRDMAEIPL